MSMMETIFVYVIPSLTVVLGLVLGIIWAIMPKTAKYLTKKKLGLLQGKTLGITAFDDRYMQGEAFEVAPEGLLETKRKRGMSKSFYLAKPRGETANAEENLINSARDMDICPPYLLDGVPVYFTHIAKAFATNPKVLTALHLSNRVSEEESKQGKFKAKAILPKPVMIEVLNPETGEKELVPQNLLDVEVRIPYDPIDIKKNIPGYLQQSNIDSTKRRYKEIGKEEVKREKSDTLKYMVVIMIAGIIVCGIIVFGGKLLGGG